MNTNVDIFGDFGGTNKLVTSHHTADNTFGLVYFDVTQQLAGA